MEFIEVCALKDFPPGTSRAVRVGSADVAIFNMDGALHAMENSCLHAGASLAGGALCGNIVSCPAHGWRYNVTTGALVVAPAMRVKIFPVEVSDGKILVGMET